MEGFISKYTPWRVMLLAIRPPTNLLQPTEGIAGRHGRYDVERPRLERGGVRNLDPP
jgi:hypothetical protein